MYYKGIDKYARWLRTKFYNTPLYRLKATFETCVQGRNVVRWRPGQEASLAPSCSQLRSFGSQCTVLKKVLVTLLGFLGVPSSYSPPPQWFGAPIMIQRRGNCAPLAPLVTLLLASLKFPIALMLAGSIVALWR